MTKPTVAMASALVTRVREAGLVWLADKLVWSVDTEHVAGLMAKTEVAQGELVVRVHPSYENPDKAEAAVNWSGNRSFTCGAYTENGDKLFWDLACAVQFASSHGILPSEED